MALFDTLSEATDSIFSTPWDASDGRVIPETENVKLKDGALKIEAAFLYADLAASAKLSTLCPWGTTAKIIRAYLDCAVRIIRARGGHIRSFDGDRVMGVFMGSRPSSEATLAAREIFHATEKIIHPKAQKEFKSIRENSISIRQAVGVDFGTVRAVRAGIRANTDLIWIGKAASLSAKLSDLREYPYCVFISQAVYKKLATDAKIVAGADIWESRSLKFAGGSETVYRTKMMKTP